MTMSLHEHHVLAETERDLADDPVLTTVATLFAEPAPPLAGGARSTGPRAASLREPRRPARGRRRVVAVVLGILLLGCVGSVVVHFWTATAVLGTLLVAATTAVLVARTRRRRAIHTDSPRSMPGAVRGAA